PAGDGHVPPGQPEHHDLLPALAADRGERALGQLHAAVVADLLVVDLGPAVARAAGDAQAGEPVVPAGGRAETGQVAVRGAVDRPELAAGQQVAVAGHKAEHGRVGTPAEPADDPAGGHVDLGDVGRPGAVHRA